MKMDQSLLFTNECTSDCLKNNIKIYIKTAPTCFGTVTSSSGSALSVLAKVTLWSCPSLFVFVAMFGSSPIQSAPEECDIHTPPRTLPI